MSQLVADLGARKQSGRGGTARASVAALSSIGFRPFFLLAAAFAGVIVPLWLGVLRGAVSGTPLVAVSWHAHEMLFGYTVAVIAGFLLTAVPNWTGRPAVKGPGLLALALLWVTGRVLLLPGVGAPLALVAAVDLAFLPALAFVIARPIIAARRWRNLPIVGIVVALWLMNVAVFLDAAGIAAGWGVMGWRAALMLVVVLMLIIGGRIIPMFTRNATGAGGIRHLPAANRLAIAGAAGLVIAPWLPLPMKVVAAIAAVTGAAVLVRGATWGAQHTLRSPILWVLHLGHAWIGVGLLLQPLALYGFPFALSASFHALALGAIGSLTLGMMSRVALGHTGRALVVSPVITASFALMTAATAIRVFVPLVRPAGYLRAVEIAGVLWAAAFVLYLIVYTPILLRPALTRASPKTARCAGRGRW